MDWMQRTLGGRKFVMALIVIGAGIFLELKRPDGISVNMAGLLAGIMATFSATNAVITAKQMGSKKSSSDLPQEWLAQGEQLVGVLSQLGQDLQEVKANASKTSQILVNMSQPRK